MGPWLNRDWTEGKIGWARIFDGLLDDIRLDKPMLRKDFAMEKGDLKFLPAVFVNAFEQSDKWLESYQSDLLPLDSDFEDIYNDRGWMDPGKTDDLIERILSDIEKNSSQGRLPEASSSLKLMYHEDMICTISGYLEPEPTGNNKMFTVRLRRPSGSGQQAVLALNGPRPEVLQGWESLGNTLWVSDRAAIRGQRDGGWRLKAPEGEPGSFVEHLAEDLQSLYKDSSDDEYIRIPDVVAFQHEDGHADARFNLQLHKLHALYVVAFDKYCKDKPTS